MFKLIALLIQSACQMVCDRWRAARARWVVRYQMMDQMKTLGNYVFFRDWGQCLETIAMNGLPKHPP